MWRATLLSMLQSMLRTLPRKVLAGAAAIGFGAIAFWALNARQHAQQTPRCAAVHPWVGTNSGFRREGDTLVLATAKQRWAIVQGPIVDHGNARAVDASVGLVVLLGCNARDAQDLQRTVTAFQPVPTLVVPGPRDDLSAIQQLPGASQIAIATGVRALRVVGPNHENILAISPSADARWVVPGGCSADEPVRNDPPARSDPIARHIAWRAPIASTVPGQRVYVAWPTADIGQTLVPSLSGDTHFGVDGPVASTILIEDFHD